jgi:hypothetical protein
MARQHPRWSIGKAQTWDPKSRNSIEVSSLALVRFRILMNAVDQRQLFSERHFGEQRIDAGVAGYHRHTLSRPHS